VCSLRWPFQKCGGWDRIDQLGIGDEPVSRAAEVFEALIDQDIARIEYREAGARRITDSGRLAALTGLDAEQWTQCSDGFAEGAELVVPWSVTEQIASAAAQPGTDSGGRPQRGERGAT
jgi:hypothetical protein